VQSAGKSTKKRRNGAQDKTLHQQKDKSQHQSAASCGKQSGSTAAVDANKAPAAAAAHHKQRLNKSSMRKERKKGKAAHLTTASTEVSGKHEGKPGSKQLAHGDDTRAARKAQDDKAIDALAASGAEQGSGKRRKKSAGNRGDADDLDKMLTKRARQLFGLGSGKGSSTPLAVDSRWLQ
jgi:hypothetical protein